MSALVRRLTIRTKQGLAKLEPNWAQQEYLEAIEDARFRGRPVRLIVLKARQLGISTITEAVIFWDRFIYEQTFGLVIAHQSGSAEHLFGMTRFYWETFPFRNRYQQKYHTRRELTWMETGSSIQVATAGNEGVGRGRTIHDLHASEVALWEYPEDTMLALRQTIPQVPESLIVMESTANGVGNYFYETWQAAEDGDVEFVPLFFPWWRHDEYTASWMGLPHDTLGRLDEEERALGKLGVDEDHLAWRRFAIANLAGGDLLGFQQEYPATAEEAFVTSGSNVFPVTKLRACLEEKRGDRGNIINGAFVPNPQGPLTIFKYPSPDRDHGTYFAAADPTHLNARDYACIQVINRRTYEQVAVWHGRIDPVHMADVLVAIGRFYNEAMISTEVEGPGYATIGRLTALSYYNVWQHRWADKVPGKVSQNFGWSTNWKRKDWMIGQLAERIIDNSIILHDKFTFEEMRGYQHMNDGGMGAQFKGTLGDTHYNPMNHDDRVMALAQAVVCSITEGPLTGYGTEAEPSIDTVPAWMDWSDAI